MKNYSIFKIGIEHLKKAKLENKIYGRDLRYKKTEGSTNIFMVDELLSEAHLFNIDDKLKKLFILTDNDNISYIERLPFDKIFLDVAFIDKENKMDYHKNLIGILIVDMKNKEGIIPLRIKTSGGLRETEERDKIKSAVRVFTFGDDKRNLNVEGNKVNSSVWLEEINMVNYKGDYKLGVDTKQPQTRKFIINFVNNFLAFINNPEVKIIKVEREERNFKRDIRKYGVAGSKIRCDIVINGYLKEYINKLNNKGYFDYSHRFWVRGHYRTLKNKRYKDKVGTKIWILPYVKGSGILIEKEYQIKRTI